jgi:tetratricopeptide (TPR) repeat protein
MAEEKAAAERKRRQATLGLAAAVLALVVLGGTGLAWWWQERTTVMRDVEAALIEVSAHERAGRRPEARAALERAQGRLGSVGAQGLRDRMRELRSELDMVSDLEQISFRQAEVYKERGTFDLAGAGQRYAEAFRKYGIDIEALEPLEAAKRLRASPIREALLAGLDDWMGVKRDAERARLKAVADAADDNPWRLSFRGALLAKDTRTLKEMAAKAEALSQPPGMLVCLGTALNDAGLREEAVTFLQRAQQAYPGDFWLNFKLGSILLWNMRPPRLAEAALYYRVAVASRPNNAAAHSCLGAALDVLEDLDACLAECRKAIDLDPELSAAHNNLGLALLKKGDTDAAIREYRRAIELASDSISPHFNLSAALRAKGDLDGAVAEYREIVKNHPDKAESYDQLSWTLRLQGKYKEAIAACQKAIAIQPREPNFHDSLGLALKDSGDQDGAIAEFRKAIELDARYTPARHNLWEIFRDRKDWDKAVAEYRKIVEIDPKSAAAHDFLGWTLQAKGDSTSAVNELRQAVALDPKRVAAHIALGWALLSKGDLDGSLAAYRQVLSLEPKHAGANNGIGRVLEAKHDREGALRAYREAVASDPKWADPRNSLAKFLGPKAALEEARVAWEKSLDSNSPNHNAWFGYAELCLFLGHEDAYRKARSALLARFRDTTDVAVAERTGRACLLLPASGDELTQAAALTDRALAAGSKHPLYAYFQLAKALADYRRNQFDSAIHLLREVGTKIGVAPRLLLAMALYGNGQKEAARRTFTAATLDYDWAEARADGHDAWIRHVLRREADALIVPELPAFLKGTYTPDDEAEWEALGAACWARELLVTAVRRFAEAFAKDTKLAENPVGVRRYNAACFAALAGTGRGEEAARLDEKERSRLRKQALDWLRAELDAHTKHLAGGKPEERSRWLRQLQHWQTDPDLAGIRDTPAVAKLPQAEQESCKALWADLQTLLKKVQQ